MEKAYKSLLLPNKTKEQLIQKTFGCARYVYNYFLDLRKTHYETTKETLSFYDTEKLLTQLKKETTWLKDVDSSALNCALKDLDDAYKNFFRRVKKGEVPGYPKFKSKYDNNKSYRTRYVNDNIRVLDENHIRLPKLGRVRVKNLQTIQGRILSATVSQVPSGKYYVSLCCTDVEFEPLPKTGKQIGIDLGIKDFLITSDGEKFSGVKSLKQSLEKMAKLQRKLSRQKKGSGRYNQTRLKIAKLHDHISHQRSYFLHNLSTKLIREYDVICIEDLSVADMIQDSRFAIDILDASWSEFVRQLEYKAEWYGREVIKVDKYYASSQTCSCCGEKSPITKNLKIRKWVCPNCGAELDRDVNAANNILKRGLEIKKERETLIA